ncbi:MAG TPA: FISUMP domain-containing protein [Bacteroidales bacterium]|nr:FISUMP domain-containing protein [Bacteroidales bacterium]
MKSILLTAALCFWIIFQAELTAQPFQLTFSGSGLSTTVTSVEVQNLTQGTSLTINGSDILELQSSVGMEGQWKGQEAGLHVWPNPSDGTFWIGYDHPTNGRVVIEILDISGKQIVSSSFGIPEGYHLFRATGLPNGSQALRITSDYSIQTGNLIVIGSNGGSPILERSSSSSSAQGLKKMPSLTAIIPMPYNSGDRLLLKGISGNHARVLTLIPTQSQSVNFEFISCTDTDGNHYPVVSIGTQTWMAENLKTSRYNNGTAIPVVTDSTAWVSLSTGACCWYNNDSATYAATYGSLYNWHAVNNGNLCPTGWHVPTDAEWTVLTDFLGGESVAGGPLKETDTLHWNSPNTGATNSSGFTALPGGYRNYGNGHFNHVGYHGYWWSSSAYLSTYAWFRRLYYIGSNVTRDFYSKTYGFSVRCIKGDPVALPPTSVFTANDTTVMVIDTVFFTDQSLNNPTSWKWYFGDGDSSQIQHPQHVYQFAGTFTVVLTVTNPAGSNTLIKQNYIQVSAPPQTFPVYDVDGNGYDTIHIGTQVWMKQNLRTSRFANGNLIPEITANGSWPGSYPRRCYYNNDSAAYAGIYGTLYNWYAVENGNLCPTGWHVPEDAEYDELSDIIGSNVGGSLKEIGTLHWNSPNTLATNSTGFTALAGGVRGYSTGNFGNMGELCVLWAETEGSTSNAYTRSLSNSSSLFTRISYSKKYGFSVRCLMNRLPIVLTDSATMLTSSAFKIHSKVSSSGGTTVTSRGICYGTSPNPTILNNSVPYGSGTGSFSPVVTGLALNTTYYLRGYATNSTGTAYGNQVTLTTPQTYKAYDYDGNAYDTVQIGTQAWLRQNLKTTHFANGVYIPNITADSSWSNATNARCWYLNDSATMGNVYGALYNRFVITYGNVCPYGYHVPTDSEWQTLETHLGMSSSQASSTGWRGTTQGGQMKESGYAHWASPNIGATNLSGFTALPGGFRSNSGTWFSIYGEGRWWTSSYQTSQIFGTEV